MTTSDSSDLGSQPAPTPATTPHRRPAEILLVEDNPADVRLTKEALSDAKLTNRLYVVGDGELAMAFLRRQAPYADAPHPDLILLDLNLPKMDGRAVLHAVKNDPELRRIPVIVLTTSSEERDIVSAYDNYANSYVTKPVEFNEFAAAIRSIEGFWLTIVTLSPS